MIVLHEAHGVRLERSEIDGRFFLVVPCNYHAETDIEAGSQAMTGEQLLDLTMALQEHVWPAV